jgi:hypothetical protein
MLFRWSAEECNEHRAKVKDYCDCCGGEGDLKRCSRCLVARFCSVGCQRRAHAEHKKVCFDGKLVRKEGEGAIISELMSDLGLNVRGYFHVSILKDTKAIEFALGKGGKVDGYKIKSSIRFFKSDEAAIRHTKIQIQRLGL